MSSITRNEPEVKKELKFGKLTRSPIVAWGFDTSTSKVSPSPIAVGPRARFLDVGSAYMTSPRWSFIPATPGFYEVSYTVDPQHRKLFDVPEAEIIRAAGTFYLGTETPDDGIDWLKVACDWEYRHTFFSTDEMGSPMDEFCSALQGDTA
jgi:hypothetical protein